MRNLQPLGARPKIILAEFPALVSVLFRPDAIPAWCEDPIGVQRVLNCIVELHQCIVVPAVGPSNLVCEEQVSSVFSKAFCSSICDHSTHAPICVCFGHRISSVVHHVDDEVHLPQADAASRKRVEFAFLVPFLGNLIAASVPSLLAQRGLITYIEQLQSIFASWS